MVPRGCAAGRHLVGADDRFTLVTPPALGLVTFRQTGTDEENRNLLQAINTEGTTFLTHSEKNGTFFLRFAAGGTLTEDHHVREAWRAVQNAIPRAQHLAGGSADALPE
ncbi:hypothetical protein ACFCY8_10605 [Streptomyces noursei]|uniref:hypothetical protein n=1 Tax=Streptomyces noursei TaxID=1971 RepID=UPI0035E19D00